ncbi:MAG: hypothetical protein ABSG57_07795 [Candidatus Bathyarchaeia archaeon]
MKINRKIVSAAILIAIVVLIVATTFSYYAFYPNVFQVNGRFSVRGLDLSKSFEGSTMATSFLVLKTFDNEQLNASLEANNGWTAESLTLYNISSQEDTILFQTNGSVSLTISQPTFLFISLQNLSVSVLTGPADGAFFLDEAGGSLLLTNVTIASVPFPEGTIPIDLQVAGGSISISGNSSSVSLDNSGHGVDIRLIARILKQTNLVAAGRFQVESNIFSSVEVDCWSSPIDTYFTFADGFLSYSGISQKISGSQNLNLTGFKGAITLLNPQPPHDIIIQGSVTKIQLGESEVTAPTPFRDLVQTLTPYSGFILIVASVGLSQLVEMWKDRRKERKEKARELSKEVKDDLCAPLLQNLEDYFEPQIRLRELGAWVFLGGFVSHNENAVEVSRLELNVSKRLLVEAESSLPDLHTKVEKFALLLREYNEAYKRLAKTAEPLIKDADFTLEPNLMARAGRSIAAPKDKGGAYEWAFMSLLGASEDDLEGRLDGKQKDLGQKILGELQKHDGVMDEVRAFGEIVEKLQTSLADLKVNLEELMKSQTIPWET